MSKLIKVIIGLIEEAPKKEDCLFIKILEKAQYLMYAGIIVHMVMKLVNSMKKTFGSGKDSSKQRFATISSRSLSD